jgi:uncharacterized protein (UPF0333 family)
MDYQILFNIALTAAGFLGGWVLNNMTKAQVIGWVQDALGEEQVASYEENVANQIAALANPPVVTPALPWGA